MVYYWEDNCVWLYYGVPFVSFVINYADFEFMLMILCVLFVSWSEAHMDCCDWVISEHSVTWDYFMKSEVKWNYGVALRPYELFNWHLW